MQKFEHGGDLKKIMAQEDLDKIIDFSANINPYGLSKNIKKIQENLKKENKNIIKIGNSLSRARCKRALW